MKQLTDTEKQQLDAKIKEEEKRQQTLREANPDLPKNFKTALTETSGMSGMRRLVPKGLWKYGFLGIVLCLLAFSVMNLLRSRNFSYDQYGGPVIGLILLFNHIAYYFTTKGWKSIVMKTVAWVWIAFGLVYFFWIF